MPAIRATMHSLKVNESFAKSPVGYSANEKKENILYEKKEKLYKLNELAAKYFRECLHRTDRGKKVINYLKKRGI